MAQSASREAQRSEMEFAPKITLYAATRSSSMVSACEQAAQ